MGGGLESRCVGRVYGADGAVRVAPGPIWTGGKSRPHRDSILDRPAHSQSLYRLSYPAHIACHVLPQNTRRFYLYHKFTNAYVST